MRIPLAWFQLTREKIRLAIALAGIGFADILMFMQLGFRDALFDSAIKIHENFDGDAFLISPQSDAIIAMESFSARRLYQSLGVKGVESITPVYLNFIQFKNPETKTSRAILVIGFNPSNSIFNIEGVEKNLETIKLQDVVLFDDLSREEFGPIVSDFQAGKTVKTEVGEREVTIGGLFSIGSSFGADGNLITSDLNFLRLFPNRERGLIDVGVIQIEETANLDSVLENLKRQLNQGDVLVLSKEEFVEYERNYWENSTNIGFVFGLGTVMGLIVGVVIVYQILYTDVADHLPEYATLKAIGYSDFYLLTLVFQQAILLGMIGYLPGFAMGIFLYSQTAAATGLPIAMTVSRAITVLILTVGMCFFSGGIAVGKLRAADPADIF